MSQAKFKQTDMIDHNLHDHFPELVTYHSTKSLEQSALYQALKSQIDHCLHTYELDSSIAAPKTARPFYRATAWNIERGMCFQEILYFLKNHEILSKSDFILVTEADLGMARSGNLNIAKELAQALKMNYFFAPSYLNLAKGCGIEQDIDGENRLGVHGNAILSRYPIHKPRIVPLPNALDKMKGREKRLGQQRALVATLDLGGTPLRVGCVHADMRSSRQHRKKQIETLVKALQSEGPQPCLFGGDWNTSTYNAQNALNAIIGFWVRVLIGVDRVMRKHYPYPDSFFEKALFSMLEKEGFDYKTCNESGATTIHYGINNIKQVKNLGEWVPEWCFRFINWALRNHQGACHFKLDWFAQKNLQPLRNGEIVCPDKGPSLAPTVIGNLVKEGVEASDHDAIVYDFTL